VTMDKVLELADLADEYLCMDAVRAHVHLLLLRSHAERPLEALVVAERTGCEDAVEACFRLVSGEFPRFKDMLEFEKLPAATRLELGNRWKEYALWMVRFPDTLVWDQEKTITKRSAGHGACKENLKAFISEYVAHHPIRDTHDKFLSKETVDALILKNQCTAEWCAKRIVYGFATGFPREKFL